LPSNTLEILNLKISIVTPSYNQGSFLGECIDSVLAQKYPRLEYVVMDGGSRDGSAAIIRRRARSLHDFRIGPDGGQYHAINRGFALTTGCKADVMGWLNADDKYMPWAFALVAEIFSQFPQVEWVSTLYPVLWGQEGLPHRTLDRGKFSAAGFFLGENCRKNHLQQESTFWRRSLWERAGGGLDARWSLAADFELWARFFRHAHCYGVATTLGGFREHPSQKTALRMNDYLKQADRILDQQRQLLPSGFLLRHRLMFLLARMCGKRGYFRDRGWLAPDSYITYDRDKGWRIVGPVI
jgi:glycosyltransferase involved in cell wall biosynthesis